MSYPDQTQSAPLPPPGTALPPQQTQPAAAPAAPFDQAAAAEEAGAPAQDAAAVATATPAASPPAELAAALAIEQISEPVKLETSITKVKDAIEFCLELKGASFKVLAGPLLNGLALPDDPDLLDAILLDGARMLLGLRSDTAAATHLEVQNPAPPAPGTAEQSA
jgi:hypothetical protein